MFQIVITKTISNQIYIQTVCVKIGISAVKACKSEVGPTLKSCIIEIKLAIDINCNRNDCILCSLAMIRKIIDKTTNIVEVKSLLYHIIAVKIDDKAIPMAAIFDSLSSREHLIKRFEKIQLPI